MGTTYSKVQLPSGTNLSLDKVFIYVWFLAVKSFLLKFDSRRNNCIYIFNAVYMFKNSFFHCTEQ